LQPKVKMALRTSGHLLLGVVRIYSRKAKYLLADCNEAFVKIKMAFRPGMVDLPEENREAAVNAITLPEVFHDFDTAMPSLEDVDLQSQFTMNQSRAEEITMREDYGNINLEAPNDDDFGDMMHNDDEPSELRGESLAPQRSLFDEQDEPAPGPSNQKSLDLGPPMMDDGFGSNIGGDFGDAGVEGGGGLFDEPVMAEVSNAPSEPRIGSFRRTSMSDDGFDAGGDLPSPGGMSSPGNSRPATPMGTPAATPSHATPHSSQHAMAAPPTPAALQAAPITPQEQTTLLHNEEESFALAPVDTSALRGGPIRTKRKRKLIVDEVKAIAGEEMKAQLSDTQDIVTTLDLAPPTKRLMHWKETGGVEKLFALPGKPLPSRSLFDSYQNHLVSHPTENEDFGLLGDSEADTIQLENVPGGPIETEDPRTVGPKKPGRKRKEPVEQQQEEVVSPPVKRSSRLQAIQEQPQKENVPPIEPPQTPGGPAAGEQHPISAEDAVFGQSASENPQTPHHQVQQPSGLENLGYDQTNPNNEMTNFGYTGEGAPTPGAVSMGGATPYRDDDYYNPASMASIKAAEEEQMQDGETIEEFEDRVLNKRAGHLNHLLQAKLQDSMSLHFSELTRRNIRKQAAQKFYSMLVLQKVTAVNIDQADAFGPIMITKGPNFDKCVL